MLVVPGVADALEEQQREDVRLEVRRVDRAAQAVGGGPEAALEFLLRQRHGSPRTLLGPAEGLLHEGGQKVLVLREVGLGDADAVMAPTAVVVHQVEAGRIELRLRLVGPFQPDLDEQPDLLRTEDDGVSERPSLARPM